MKALLKIILLLVLLAGAAWGTVTFVQQAEARAAANPPAAGGGGGGGRGPSGPLSAEAYVVVHQSVPYNIRVIGSLMANEVVEITSEQSRRLTAIHVQEGELVKQGDLLFELDDSDLKASMGELKARRELAIINERRLRQLLETQTASQAEYDRVRSELDVIDAQIKQIQTELDRTQIAAPFAGRVGLRRVSLGAWVTPSTVLTSLQDVSSIKIDFKVPERHAPAIRPGGRFTFRPEGSGKWTEGKVLAVEPAIESQTRSLIVRGIATNPQNELFPGAFAEVELPLRTDENSVLIPSQAVVPSAQGSSVFVYSEGKARVRPIELGIRLADQVQVLTGLEPGDQVLITNLLRLRPGADVVLTNPQP
jgi:membrane fusion protein (multidrug efflux system)